METLNPDLLPEEAKKGLKEYYMFLKEKYSRQAKEKKLPSDFYNPVEIDSSKGIDENLLLSETSLKKDWLTNGEDEAWADL